jgi:hypothetical protein
MEPVSWDKQIFVTRSDNSGTTWNTPVQVTDNEDEQYHPRIAASHNSETTLVVAYTRDYSTNSDVESNYSTNDGASWSVPQYLPWSSADEKSADIAVSNSGGRFHAAYYHDSWDVWYSWAPVSNPGNWSSPAVTVNDGNQASAVYPWPTITVNPNLPEETEAAVAWSDHRGPSGNYDVYFDSPGIVSTYGDELAADFGGSGLWHYDGTGTWTRIAVWNPDDDLAGWDGGLAVDFGTNGLYNSPDGATWNKMVGWNADGLEGCHNGLYSDFGGYGLWFYSGTAWSKMVNWNPENMACWSGGLAVDFGANYLWNYNGTSWTKLVNWNPGADGLAGWMDDLAVDFDGNGLWNYNGTSWTKMVGWNAQGLEGSACGLGADFGANGLWVHDGTAWTKESGWNPEGQSAMGSGHCVDFGANGIYEWDCASGWNRITTLNPENMDDVDLN